MASNRGWQVSRGDIVRRVSGQNLRADVPLLEDGSTLQFADNVGLDAVVKLRC